MLNTHRNTVHSRKHYNNETNKIQAIPDSVPSLIESFSKVLMATNSPVMWWTALRTFPNVPFPMVSMTW